MNADKNNKNTSKKIRIYRTKAFKVLIAQENHSQITTELLEHSPLIVIAFKEDIQIEETLKTIHRVDIADQNRQSTQNRYNYFDQSLKEVITQTIIEIAHIQTLRIQTYVMTAQEIIQTTAIEIFQIILIEITLTKDHTAIQTTDRIVIIKTKDLEVDRELSKQIKKHLIILVKETITVKTDQEIILSHRIGVTNTAGVAYQNIKDKSTKYNLQMKPAQALQLLTIQKLQISTKPHTL